MIKVCDINIGPGYPIVLIAGPCVIEDEISCRQIAEFLKKISNKNGIPLIFKASFDKANRTSIKSYRGPGLKEGLCILKSIQEELNIPVLTDVHCVTQVSAVAECVDVIQIPAFLCRQTDLIIESAKTGRTINIKKGQFMAPNDMKNVVDKARHVGNNNILLTERGTSFGYNNLIVDMRSLVIMRKIGCPVVFDATHSVQLPGGVGNSSGGEKEFVPYLARAATALGIDALFMEVHPFPEKALCDGPNSLQLDELDELIQEIVSIDRLIKEIGKNKGSSMVGKRAEKIKMIVMDVDGVLTDGKVILGTNGIELKSFNSKDGYWIRIAQKAGLKLAIITGRESDIVSKRARELNIEDVHQGVLNKLEAYQKIIDKYGLKDDEIAYIGDDLVDLPILTRVGLSVVVADALPDLKDRVDYVTKNPGGHGAGKEMIELILKSQNKLDSIINKHL